MSEPLKKEIDFPLLNDFCKNVRLEMLKNKSLRNDFVKLNLNYEDKNKKNVQEDIQENVEEDIQENNYIIKYKIFDNSNLSIESIFKYINDKWYIYIPKPLKIKRGDNIIKAHNIKSFSLNICLQPELNQDSFYYQFLALSNEERKGIIVAAGVIDPNYLGEISILLYNATMMDHIINYDQPYGIVEFSKFVKVEFTNNLNYYIQYKYNKNKNIVYYEGEIPYSAYDNNDETPLFLSAGYDLKNLETTIISKNSRINCKTRTKLLLPNHIKAFIHPRSSTVTKFNCIVSIEEISNYDLENIDWVAYDISFQPNDTNKLYLENNEDDKKVQIVFIENNERNNLMNNIKFKQTNNFEHTIRGNKGFGSTSNTNGKK